MKVTETTLPEVLLLEPRVFEDDRGCFFESWNRRTFAEATGIEVEFVQDNHSVSERGVLRGLHYQLDPSAQGKLVRVTVGEVFDVAVDIRRGSPRFGTWTAARLSAENRHQLWVPTGFAHGFLTLSDRAEVQYKTTGFYDPTAERSIIWNDTEIGIDWPEEGLPEGEALLSAKDAAAPPFARADVFG